MTKQEYIYIRNLAWDILIDSKVNSLPVDVSRIESIYSIPHQTNLTRYNRMLRASNAILNIYGLSNEAENSVHLSVRVLAPMIVLNKLGVSSPEELASYTGLPISLAIRRFERLVMLRKRNAFETSRMESRVLKQFSGWITSNTH